MKEYIEKETARAELIINDELYAADIVKAIPAADVVEVKKAKWITGNENPRTYGRIRSMCGRCGAFALYEFVNVGSFGECLSNYCPNCGADMREES